MKQIQQIGQCLMILGTLFLPFQSFAAQDEECSQEILLSYYPSAFVRETLEKFNVPRKEWDAIVKELASKDIDVIKNVEAKAARMGSNPLKDPQQRQAAVKLFRDTLIENFASVLKAHGVTDDKQIQTMLEDIQQQKAKRFAKCMEKERSLQQQQGGNRRPMPSPQDQESDSDDDDESEDED